MRERERWRDMFARLLGGPEIEIASRVGCSRVRRRAHLNSAIDLENSSEILPLRNVLER